MDPAVHLFILPASPHSGVSLTAGPGPALGGGGGGQEGASLPEWPAGQACMGRPIKGVYTVPIRQAQGIPVSRDHRRQPHQRACFPARNSSPQHP